MTQQPITRYEAPITLHAEGRRAMCARAIAAATKVAADHGIRVVEPAILADRYAVRVHLRPAPLVARVSTFTALLRQPIEAWLKRELDVTRFLHGCGAPVVPPSELLPAGPHLQDGFGISFWSFEAPVSDVTPAPDTAGRMLAELHAALRNYPGELPLLAPPLNDIPRGLARLERMPEVIAAADLSMLRRVADRLLPALDDASTPIQPLHGDAHVHNMIASARGLLWNDFEDVCKGPVAWDLCSQGELDNKLLASYPGAPPVETLEIYRRVRLLHASVWVLALLPEVDEWAVHAQGMLDALRPWA